MMGTFRRTRLSLLGLAVTAITVLGAQGIASAAVGPNLIVNGSFETPAVTFGTYSIFPSIQGWNFKSRVGVASAGIEIQNHVAGNPAVLPFGAMPAGNQFVELDSTAPYVLYQDVPTVPGKTYRLEFLYSPRPGTPAGDNMFRVSAARQSALIGPLTSGPNTMWNVYSMKFEATCFMTRVRFEDASNLATTLLSYGPYIDRVTLRQL